MPPMPNQPGGVWLPLKVPQTLYGVLALPVQYSAYGVYWSAFGRDVRVLAARRARAASAHWVVPLP